MLWGEGQKPFWRLYLEKAMNKKKPAWGWLCDAHRQLNGAEARDCLVFFFFFLSRRMILELRKEDQTWLRGKRCPEGVRGERKGPNLTECSLGPRRREAAPPSQKNPASEAHSCLPLGLSFHVDLFVWCTPAPSQTPLEVMGLEINRTILAPQELIQVDR